MSNKKLITYITNWDRVNEDVIEKENDLKKNKIKYYVINSSSNLNNKNWIDIGTEAWCYRQLFETFKHASKQNYDYVSILFGDIYAPENSTISDFIFETQEKINTLPDCFVYSTSFTHDGWSYPTAIIKKYDDEVSYVCGTDTLYLTVHRDVVNFCFKFLKHFDNLYKIDNFSSGWAVDVVCSAYSIYNKKNVFRNTKSILTHYENSGYDVSKAYREMQLLLSESVNFASTSYGYDSNKFKNIIDMMFRQRTSHAHTFEEFYA